MLSVFCLPNKIICSIYKAQSNCSIFVTIAFKSKCEITWATTGDKIVCRKALWADLSFLLVLWPYVSVPKLKTIARWHNIIQVRKFLGPRPRTPPPAMGLGHQRIYSRAYRNNHNSKQNPIVPKVFLAFKMFSGWSFFTKNLLIDPYEILASEMISSNTV